MADTSVSLDENDREIISFISNHHKNVIVLLNKSDLPHVVTEEEVSQIFDEFSKGDSEKDNLKKNRAEEYGIGENGINSRKIIMVKASAKNNSGLETLEKTIKDIFFQGEIKSSNEIVITNMRHKEALQEAYNSLELVKKSIQDGMPEDFYYIDLMNAYSSLGRIIGEEVDDDLIEEIFSKFCMGK